MAFFCIKLSTKFYKKATFLEVVTILSTKSKKEKKNSSEIHRTAAQPLSPFLPTLSHSVSVNPRQSAVTSFIATI